MWLDGLVRLPAIHYITLDATLPLLFCFSSNFYFTLIIYSHFVIVLIQICVTMSQGKDQLAWQTLKQLSRKCSKHLIFKWVKMFAFNVFWFICWIAKLACLWEVESHIYLGKECPSDGECEIDFKTSILFLLSNWFPIYVF